MKLIEENEDYICSSGIKKIGLTGLVQCGKHLYWRLTDRICEN